MARLAKVYQCMGMMLQMRIRMLMNIGLGRVFMGGKRFFAASWHIFIDYDMVSIPTNFLGTADTPSGY